jgi:hypothetical protein
MATKRRTRRSNRRRTRRYKRGGSESKVNRANRLHMAFGKQRAFAFASH